MKITYTIEAKTKRNKLILTAVPDDLKRIDRELQDWQREQDGIEEILSDIDDPEIEEESTPDYIYELADKLQELEKFQEDHTAEIEIGSDGYIGENLLYTTADKIGTAEEAAHTCLIKNLHNLPEWIEPTKENKETIQRALEDIFYFIIDTEQDDIETFFRCDEQMESAGMTIEKLRELDSEKQTEIIESFYEWLVE